MRGKLERVLRTVTLREMGPATARAVSPETSLGEVHRTLERDRCGAVVVTEEDRVVGIFTERDVLNRTALGAFDPATPIRELMTPEPRILSAKHHVADAVREMTDGGLRQIPVVDESGRLRGIVSSRDVLRFIAAYYPESVLNLPPRLRQRLTHPEGG